jgi:ribosomal protein L23
MNEPYDIIDTVRLTEKATLLAEKENKYVFRVKPHANKTRSSKRSKSFSRRLWLR